MHITAVIGKTAALFERRIDLKSQLGEACGNR
jgi:hypothetical protein